MNRAQRREEQATIRRLERDVRANPPLTREQAKRLASRLYQEAIDDDVVSVEGVHAMLRRVFGPLFPDVPDGNGTDGSMHPDLLAELALFDPASEALAELQERDDGAPLPAVAYRGL